MLLRAAERGDESLQTGRFIISFKESREEEAANYLSSLDLRSADARDFGERGASMEDAGDADAMFFPELGVAVVTADAAESRSLGTQEEESSDSPVQAVEPDLFMFAEGLSDDYLRGFRKAVETLAAEGGQAAYEPEHEIDPQVLGATWGLTACKVPPSTRTGAGIRVAVLDTGFALGHPDFVGRSIFGATFVGQPVQDLNGHGTHCTGTACGPKAPPGFTPRYGIGHNSQIFIGKVLTNAGGGTSASVLAGMNWAIANRCAVISMSLGAQGVPPQLYYTQAGQRALNAGCLIVAAAGNNYPGFTNAPANSPTIMSIASVDQNLAPSAFSCQGKVELAAPGRDVFSSWFMPPRYRTISGTSMATPHAAGCAALWAQTSPALRGPALWHKLLATARPLSYPPTRVGRGLVQAPL
jgi:subtilisin family serine protease